MSKFQSAKTWMGAGVLATALLAGAAGFVHAETNEKDAQILEGISIGAVDVGGMSATQALQVLDEYVEEMKETTFVLRGEIGNLEISGREMGIEANLEPCVQEAVLYAGQGNLIERFKQKKKLEEAEISIPLRLTMDKQKTGNLIYHAKNNIEIPAEDNGVRKEGDNFVYVEGKSGVEVDIVSSVYAISDALSQWKPGQAEIDLVLVELEPRGTKEELMQMTDILGSYHTSYTSSGAGRSQNVSNGCSKINGKILFPGDEASVYEMISPFTQANGYELAGSYSNGTTVESFGGGVCQVSTTLYNALIRAEVDITKRYNHSMSVSYVDLSADAAIAGTYKDLRFCNNYDFPIYIEGICENKKIYFNIYGKETRESGRTVSFESEVFETIPAETKFELNGGTAFGVVSKVQGSHTGYKSRLWKIVSVDGQVQSKEEFNKSNYQASPAIYLVGTSGATEEQLATLHAAVETGDLGAVKAAAALATEPSEEEPTEGEDANGATGDGTTENNGGTEGNTGEKPEQKPEQKPEPKPEQKPEEKPEPKPEQKPEPKPEEKPSNDTEPKPEQEPKPEEGTDVEPTPEPEQNLESEPVEDTGEPLEQFGSAEVTE